MSNFVKILSAVLEMLHANRRDDGQIGMEKLIGAFELLVVNANKMEIVEKRCK
jgi:hypothetical protein